MRGGCFAPFELVGSNEVTMKIRAAFVFLLLLVFLPGVSEARAQAPQRPERGSVEIFVDGEPRLGIRPLVDPDLEEGAGVLFPVEVQADLFVRDRRQFGVLEAIAWREDRGARVVVYGLASEEVPSAKRYLGSVFIEWDTTAEFERLELFGVRGVSMRAGPAPRR